MVAKKLDGMTFVYENLVYTLFDLGLGVEDLKGLEVVISIFNYDASSYSHYVSNYLVCDKIA